jgi:predicted DCC family thiol-disulfide oxidoreductase YuxK
VARVVVLLDRRQELAILPMHDAAAGPLLASLPTDDRFATWHLVRGDGSLVGGGTGLVGLLKSMRLTRPAGEVLAAVPDRVLEKLYALIARHRSRLGRLVPRGPAPRRFP